MNFMKDSLLA